MIPSGRFESIDFNQSRKVVVFDERREQQFFNNDEIGQIIEYLATFKEQ